MPRNEWEAAHSRGVPRNEWEAAHIRGVPRNEWEAAHSTEVCLAMSDRQHRCGQTRLGMLCTILNLQQLRSEALGSMAAQAFFLSVCFYADLPPVALPTILTTSEIMASVTKEKNHAQCSTQKNILRGGRKLIFVILILADNTSSCVGSTTGGGGSIRAVVSSAERWSEPTTNDQWGHNTLHALIHVHNS